MKHDRLKNLFDFLPKSKIKAGDGLETGKYPFYTSSDNQTKYLDKYLYESGCLVFGTGGKASVHFTTSRFATSTDCITIKPNLRLKIDAGYVFHYFKGNMKVLESGFKGAGLKHISKAYLSDIQIPHPENIDDQIRIAHLLSNVEGLIAQRKQHLQQLDDFLKSVFLEMFGDPVRNEKGWETKKLGNIALIERGRFSPRPRNDPKFYNGVHPFIQTGDINRSNGRLKEYSQTLNDLGTKVSKEFKVGTIVIAIVGATIGETAILEIPTYAPDSVIGITPKSPDLATEAVFMEYTLRFWKPVLKAKAPEAARANINIQTLRPLPIIMPRGGDRMKFSAISTKVETLKFSYQQSLDELENLYGALSQKAFKGELDLSRVPLVPIDNHENQVVNDKQLFGEELAKEVAMFESLDKSAMATPEGRERLLRQWFMDWLNNASPSATLSVPQFWQKVQLQALDYEGEDDEDTDFKVAEYDQFKQWLFEAINKGQILQTQNIVSEPGEELRFGNRVVLNKAQ